MKFSRRTMMGGAAAAGVAGAATPRAARADSNVIGPPALTASKDTLASPPLVPDNDESSDPTDIYVQGGPSYRTEYPEQFGQNAYRNIPSPTNREQWAAPYVHNKHEDQSVIEEMQDGIERAYHATGIDPAFLAAFHATETQQPKTSLPAHYAITKTPDNKDHVGPTVGSPQWFGPVQLSKVVYDDIHKAGEANAPLEKGKGSIANLILNNPQFSALLAARFLQKIYSHYCKSMAKDTPEQRMQRVLTTIGKYNAGPSYDLNSIPSATRDYIRRFQENYKLHGGTNLADAIPERDWSSRRVKPQFENFTRSFSVVKITPFPFAIWPNR